MCVALRIKLFVIFEREKGEKSQIRILGHHALSQALRTEFTEWFYFPLVF